jgi:hypothetical protein
MCKRYWRVKEALQVHHRTIVSPSNELEKTLMSENNHNNNHVGKTCNTHRSGEESLHQKTALTSHLPRLSVPDAVSSEFMHDALDRPRTLLPTHQVSDFSRNFADLEKRAKHPYSVMRLVRGLSSVVGRIKPSQSWSNQNRPLF